MGRVQMARRGGGPSAASMVLAHVVVEEVEGDAGRPDSGEGVRFFLTVYGSWSG